MRYIKIRMNRTIRNTAIITQLLEIDVSLKWVQLLHSAKHLNIILFVISLFYKLNINILLNYIYHNYISPQYFTSIIDT